MIILPILAILLGGLWLLGSLIYLCMVWRDVPRDLVTRGRRSLPLMDLIVFLIWPVLLLIDLMIPVIERFKTARDY